MIIVTGSVQARPETVDEVLRLCLEHVLRSRSEPGCLLHSVHRDVEDQNRFAFIEHWVDDNSLKAHFAVPASNEFVRAVGTLSSGRPSIEIFEAMRVSV